MQLQTSRSLHVEFLPHACAVMPRTCYSKDLWIVGDGPLREVTFSTMFIQAETVLQS
jgi:hypothetical protein